MEHPEIIRDRHGRNHFHDGSPAERLALMLNGSLVYGPNEEERRAEAETEARERIDGDTGFGLVRERAEAAIGRGSALKDELDRLARDTWPDRLQTLAGAQVDGFLETLVADTERVGATLANVREFWKQPALAAPVTAVDAVSLQTWLQLLDTSTPDQVREIIADAIQRGDRALLERARLQINAWCEYRNSWQGVAAQEVAGETLEMIDRATWSVDRYASEYAVERSEAFAANWSYLATTLSGGEYRLDPTHRQVGALAPLLEADPGV